jgi:hypothetical protein
MVCLIIPNEEILPTMISLRTEDQFAKTEKYITHLINYYMHLSISHSKEKREKKENMH